MASFVNIFIVFTSLSLTNILQNHVEALEGLVYDYNNPDDWPNIFPLCTGKQQSPVDLYERNATISTHPPLQLKGMKTTPSKMTLGQIDDDVQLLIEYDQDPFIISGGSLDSKYKLFSAFIHWGPENGIGGEHSINGKGASMSIEFVAYNLKYGDVHTAFKQSDGLIAFAKLIDVHESDFNAGLKKLLPKVPEIEDPSARVDIKPFPLAEFMAKEDNEKQSFSFLQYYGSMVQPPCRECGTWFINIQRVHASQEFVDAFRKIRKQTYRPLQPLNARKVYRTTGVLV